jgi:hypothetical protein
VGSVSLRGFAHVAGLLGGACWVARAVVDELDASPAAVDGLHWGGTALIAITLISLGADLVSSSATWLRVIVSICLPLLVWSVLEAFRQGLPDRRVEGGFGALLAVYCVVGLVRGWRHGRLHPHGSHAR